MKKKNIIAVFASLALVLTTFASCGNGDDGESTNPTVVGADGQVYEEVTEVVTDASGEPVTDAEGNTQVVTVTKPVETTEGNADTGTTAGSQQGGSEGTTTYEDVTFPEGEEIEVEVDDKGRPKNSKMDKLLDAVVNNQTFYISLTFVNTNSISGSMFDTGATVKFYIKKEKFAMEFPLGLAPLRVAYDSKEMHIILPATKNYFSSPMEADSSMLEESKSMWESLDSSAMEYDSTTNVKIRGVDYVCEIYSDGTNINKYYFDSNDEFKRMETIAADGTTTIIKVNECSAEFDDSVFSVPKGYEPIPEEALAGIFSNMFGSMGITA